MSLDVLVINFGSQYAHLITRRLRDLGVTSKLISPQEMKHYLETNPPKALILSGGPSSTYKQGAPTLELSDLNPTLPVLGICYGHQLLAKLHGGTVVASDAREYGIAEIQVSTSHPLFQGLDSTQIVWMSHGDKVVKLPDSFISIASSPNDENTAFANDEKKIYGLQFHPEVAHTINGSVILGNFLKLAGISFSTSHTPLLKRVLPEPVKGNVILGLSGGVDSMVTAALLNRVIPEQLHCVYVDTGLMREYDLEDVIRISNSLGLKHFHVIDAQQEFLESLKGVNDPEEKRKIIGRVFIEVFERVARELEKEFGEFHWLAQGTIYSDRVESAGTSKQAKKIKSHHNVGGLPERLGFNLLEPLKDLYKDEVRRLGLELGLPQDFVFRHPFPGPGLAVRILGEITPQKLEITRKADRILFEELKKANVYDLVWQSYAAFLPIKTVGVMGDQRTYENAIAIRIIESSDAMTADIFSLPKDLAVKISSRIINEIKGVNRVFYDITQKPPATIELE